MKSPESPELAVWRQLAASPLVREQQVAFTCATGIPLTLAPASTLAPAEGTFCVKGCLGELSGEICRSKLLRAEKRAAAQSGSIRYCCPSGLMKILVPVFIAGRHIGSLLAGPFSMHSLDQERLGSLTTLLKKLELSGREEKLQISWQLSPYVSSEKCRAAEILLQMFGKYLEEAGKQLAQRQPPQNSPLLVKIQAILAECHNGPVALKEVAARVNLSPCHFCAVFKKQTGLTFSQYRMRLRLENAINLLADGNRRVSDVVFESGFESIPYFNRAFRRRYGCSPTEYRKRLRRQNPGQENQNPDVAQTGSGNYKHVEYPVCSETGYQIMQSSTLKPQMSP